MSRPGGHERWPDNETSEQDLLGVVAPLSADMMEAVRVGPAVDKVTNDTPDYISPAA